MNKDELNELAAMAAGCEVAEVMAARLRENGELAVVVYPGPKYIYGPDVVTKLLASLGLLEGHAQELPNRHQSDQVEPVPSNKRKRSSHSGLSAGQAQDVSTHRGH